MTSILPAQRRAMGRPAVLGVDGPDLSDLSEDELASVIEAANRAAEDALLRIWERKDQEAGEARAGQQHATGSAIWPAPPTIQETPLERLRFRAMVVGMIAAGIGSYALLTYWLCS